METGPSVERPGLFYAEDDFSFLVHGVFPRSRNSELVVIMEYKSSATAKLTKNQKLGSVLRQLEPQLRDTAIQLYTRFATDCDAAMRKLVDEDLIKYRVWLRFIEDKLGREAVEQAAQILCEQAAEPVKRQLAEFVATGKIGGWLRMDRNAKYMAEHGLIRLA